MKITLFLISFLMLSGFLTALCQNDIIKIKADTWSIAVNVDHLAFGIVFPGEQLQKNLTVLYSGSGDGATEKYKPLPDAEIPTDYQGGNISDYCQDFPDNLEKCYRDLCPYIIEYSNEGEGDTVDSASVDANDTSDVWIVHLDSPAIAIEGKISQDHTGGIISVNGIYGCDLSFDVEIEEIEPYCGDGNLDPGEQCDDGNNINGDGCSSICKTEGGGGGGGGSVLISLQINNAEDCVPTEDGAYFSWRTNMASSSRVVCDTEPNPDWGTPPDYGYFLFTDEYDLSPKILNHEVKIPGLVPGKSYHCRVISSNSSSTVFEEVICSIPEEEEEEIIEEGEVKGTSTIIPSGLPRTGYGGGEK